MNRGAKKEWGGQGKRRKDKEREVEGIKAWGIELKMRGRKGGNKREGQEIRGVEGREGREGEHCQLFISAFTNAHHLLIL
jgi:hypothetical protein